MTNETEWIGVRDAEPEDTTAIVDILVDAFQRDPLAFWLYPDPEIRRAQHREMFAGLMQKRPEGAMVHVTIDLGAAAIWLPPSTKPNWNGQPDVRADVNELFAQIEAAAPDFPVWYLAFLGARRSGAGGGTALLRNILDRVDGPVALWTGNPANVAFYGRFGFREVSRHSVGRACASWLLRP